MRAPRLTLAPAHRSSILEKLLAKLEHLSHDPALYHDAARCLSEYMSSLNHHCEKCALPPAPVPSEADRSQTLDAIAEADAEVMDAFDSASVSSDSTLSSLRSDEQTAAAAIAPGPLSMLAGGTCAACASACHQAACAGPSGAAAGAGGACSVAGGLGGMPPSIAGIALPSGPLTEEQRKQRRRESNRSASSKYRSKRSSALTALMADNGSLRQQLAAVSSQNAVLGAENKLLKQQVAFLQGMLQHAPPTADAPGGTAGAAAT